MKHGKEYLGNLLTTAAIFGTMAVLCLCVAMMNMHGWFEFSGQTSKSLYTESEFMLKVKDDGRTIYKSAEGVSENLKENLLSTTYPNPHAAEAAATELPSGPWWDDYLGMRAAHAHAVNICTHSDGKVSNETGGGRHITRFRFHDNGRHFTRTDHQSQTQYGYQTYDSFFYDVSRNYCNCN